MIALEAAVEDRFMRLAKNAGLTVLKLNLAGNCGWPDRVVLLPHGRAAFIEFKRPGGKPRPLQAHTHTRLEALGYPVATFDDAKAAMAWLEGL